MHLDDERLQRVLHDDLDPAARVAALEHLEVCEACRARLDDEAREEGRLFAALRAIDTPAPMRVLALDGRSSWRRRWWARVAAAVAGVAIAGIAYAAPGSPLPALLRRVTLSPRRTVPITNPPPAPTPQPYAGIAVAPGPRLVIDVAAGADTATATVSLIDGGEVILRATGGRPLFQSDVDRVAIRNVEGVTALFIDIPRTALRVELRIGGARALLKEGPEVMTVGARDAAGRYVLPLGAAGRLRLSPPNGDRGAGTR